MEKDRLGVVARLSAECAISAIKSDVFGVCKFLNELFRAEMGWTRRFPEAIRNSGRVEETETFRPTTCNDNSSDA